VLRLLRKERSDGDNELVAESKSEDSSVDSELAHARGDRSVGDDLSRGMINACREALLKPCGLHTAW